MAVECAREGIRGRRRRWPWLLAAGISFAALLRLGYAPLIDELGGDWRREVESFELALSEPARALVARAAQGLEAERLIDVHVHLAGLGTGGTGCTVNPRLLSWKHPFEFVRFGLYLSASGVDDLEHADQQYVARLTELLERASLRPRCALLAFDRMHGDDGVAQPLTSVFHVPNDYALALAAERPDLYLPCVSVHPYRDDAIFELERCAALGARMVKWLPNAMNIDPASPRCDAYYAKLRELGMVLLSHTGVEHAVPAEHMQELGNPLRLRRALDAGVVVVAAHCATLGENRDLDAAGQPTVSSFELFLRMMDEQRYEGLLFGELSAVILRNRDPEVLAELLAREDLHPRLVYGSDYPLPAMDVVVSASKLASDGFLSAEQAKLLDELYDYDPLLFDLVLKRSLRHPSSGRGFDIEAFHVPREWGW